MVRPALLVAVLALGAPPAAAGAAEAWLPATPVSAAGADAARGALAMDADGDLLLVWERSDTLEAVFRPAGGPLGAPVPLATGGVPTAASAAFDPQGNAIVVWTQGEGSIRRTHAAFRPAGGTFGASQVISAPGVFTDNPAVAVDRFGNALAVWQQGGLGVAYRPAGGAFEAPVPLGVAGTGNNGFDVAFDQQGNAVVVAARLNVTPGTTSFIEASFRPAGGAPGAMEPVASAVDGAASPSVAFDAAGNALAAYLLWDPTVVEPQVQRYRVHTALRPAGGTFGPTAPISTTNRTAWTPEVSFAPTGEAVATWMQGFQPQAAIRPAGGAFGAQQRLSPAAHDSLNGPAVAFDGQGRTLVLWSGTDGTGYAARGAIRPPGGAFGEMLTLSPAGIHANHQIRLAADAQGNAAALWLRPEDAGDRHELAGFDGAPPVLRGSAFPATGAAGAALPFSVDAVDVWSPVSVAWDFGDGASAVGAPVSHAYAAVGSYGARVTATDALGNAVTATGTVAVTPAPPTPAGGGADRLAPVLSALRVSPARFRAATRGGSLARARVGTTVRYRLSEPARVRITVQRATTGRRVGGTCRRVTALNRRRARCTRYVAVRGSASRTGRTGANRLTFRGRMNGRALAPGRYRLLARATDAAGNRGAVRRAAFRVVRR